jgi:hypothetical protein
MAAPEHVPRAVRAALERERKRAKRDAARAERKAAAAQKRESRRQLAGQKKRTRLLARSLSKQRKSFGRGFGKGVRGAFRLKL